MKALICLAFFFVAVHGGAIRYEETIEQKYRPVMVPVSSTVIPLDDLPVYKIGFGFGFNPEQFDKTVLKKGTEKKKLDLITAQNKKKDQQKNKTKSDPKSASVEFGVKVSKISEADFKKFN
ncbi:unnamed protein product [Notodromas monacha]|uniref:Uncharacterized protein n=1 Tax=Notodromas monacha TaxID=399045 RepID=A0A7R9GI00_9CRUS|nr:unnamed protein product [Notodromas monacha]CAG0921304.1 unnamed protein product [Notodromas monacha]